MKPVSISIILPVYNQADHLEQVVSDYLKALTDKAYSFELILVPNGCKDNSIEVCKELSVRDKRVTWLESETAGWGSAVRTGLRRACADWIAYTNLARTSADQLVQVLSYAIQCPDSVVKANRKIRSSFLRRLGSFLYNYECRWMFDLSTWDINGTPKIFPSKFSKLKQLTQNNDLIDLEFNLICRRMKYPVIEVPLISIKRHGGNSTTNLKTAWKLYAGAVHFWLRDRKGAAL